MPIEEQYAAIYIRPALKNSERFRDLVGSELELLNIVRDLPKFAEDLIKVILENPDEFKRIAPHAYSLDRVIKALPQFAEALKAKFIEIYIEPVLKDPEKFKQFVFYVELHWLRKVFPQYADVLEDRYFKPLFDNPHKLANYNITNEDQLRSEMEEFPRLAKALEELYNKVYNKKSAPLFGEVGKTGTSLFVPREEKMLGKMGGSTSDPQVLNDPFVRR